ncbi:MAG: hypothetical protein SFX73_03250 [Kofleriaceae bacterium]|nr:hypothetical protein [Kofleriaceae bacterium]
MLDRLTDAGAIEQRLLTLAFTTDAKLTAPALAYFAPCSVDDAERVLEALAARDRLQMEIEDDGTVVYELRGRQQLASLEREVPRPPPTLVHVPTVVPTVSPALAAGLSMFIPGAGHLYAGRVVSAVLWFLVVSAGYVLLLPGLVLHLFNIVSAAGAAARRNLVTQQRLLAAPRAA